MRMMLGTALLAVLLAGCGENKVENAEPVTSTMTPEAHSEQSHDALKANAKKESLRGYSKGVQDFYGVDAITQPVGDEHIDIEIEYHQPPRPGETDLGKPIALTGTNIGVRLVATVKQVHTVGEYTAVDLGLENTGIAVHDDALRNATLTYDDGQTEPVKATKVSCSKGFEDVVRIDVSFKAAGCLVFPKSGDAKPERFQLSLENVPVEAGGIWDLK